MPVPGVKSAVAEGTAAYSISTLSPSRVCQLTRAEVFPMESTEREVTASPCTARASISHAVVLRSARSCPSGTTAVVSCRRQPLPPVRGSP